MKIKELLPIGSVVLLKDATKKLMIFGIAQVDMETKESFDYLGVAYPEGSMGECSQFLFNNTDIDTVFFKGYEDEEREKFIESLDDFYNNGTV